MFSKILTLLLALAVIGGCAKEGVRPSKPVQVKLKDGGDCLTSFGENITKYQKGALSAAQVSGFWTCVQEAVREYQEITAGDQVGGAYTPQALRRFMQRYFLKSEDISDPLLSSLMEIKRVFLGGSVRAISRQELVQLNEFLDLLKNISVDMNPYVNIIFLNGTSADDASIRRAGSVAEQSLIRLGEWLEKNGQPFSFVQLRGLILSLKDFRKKDKQTSEIFDLLDEGLAILPPVKQILLSGPRYSINGDEWRRLAISLGQSVRTFLAMKYAFKDDLNTALNREAIPFGLDFAVQILERGALANRKVEIPLSDWQELFHQLEKTGWLPAAFTEGNLMFAFNWFLNRTLASGQGAPATALTLNHIAQLRGILSDWKMLRKGALGYGPLTGTVGERFRKAIAASAAQEWDEQGRMAFPVDPARTWTPNGTLHMVWPFVVMNWLKESFSPGESLEVNEVIMGKAGLEILAVMRKFGWLTETKDTIGKQLLREGDLFTSSSNGNGLIDLSEATRYLAFIASSFRAAQIWLAQADSVCGGRGADCTRRLAADLDRDILVSMPRLQNWLRQKNTVPRFVAFMKAGEETILNKVIVGEFSTGDVLQVWMIFQYVETFLLRYDRDFSDTISLKESNPAFDVYGPTLGKLLSGVGLPPEELFGFFTFMMKYGDTPFTMFGGQVLYNHWKWHRNDWAFESDRTHLMGILNQLSKL